ncbi:uncharacterized protein K02A2.6-like [Topomyia yanbarensis]|uniref:uncharacterized protein K02A2.6-like n=1 Tax=Topomyia yanbarensis TaxID=2498891 RepID=UPI00273B8BDD|nr:uncharacterized protein K02A2.6-like [Topomyia yanbarensis]
MCSRMFDGDGFARSSKQKECDLNKPLQTKGTSAIAAARLQRWARMLAGYHYTIEHRPDKFMTHADALSRLPLPTLTEVEHVGLGINNLSPSSPAVIDLDIVRTHQKADKILSQVFEYVSRGWPKNIDQSLKPYFLINCHLGIDDNVLYFDDRVVVPDSLKLAIIEQLHSNHDGIVRMKILGRMYIWWKIFDKDVAEFVRKCKVCQQRQAVPKEVVETKWPISQRPFQRIHMDLFYFENNTLLIVVDSFSKFIDVRLMKGSNSIQMIEQVESIFAFFGIAEEVVTDNGPPFNSELFIRFLEANDVKLSKSPPYHPQSNGLAERGVRTVKDVLKK